MYLDQARDNAPMDGLPLSKIQAICFDAFGTLIDISSIDTFLEERFPGNGSAISSAWRIKQIDYSRLRSLGNRYKPFGEITEDALRASLASLNINVERESIREIMDQYMKCGVYPDTLEVLENLPTPWAIVTNGDRDFISPILQGAGIGVSDEALITSDQVSDFKVSPRLYELAYAWARNYQAETKSEVLFVSANQWDAIGATWFGFTTCWINRNSQTPEELDAAPTYEVTDLTQVLELAKEFTC